MEQKHLWLSPRSIVVIMIILVVAVAVLGARSCRSSSPGKGEPLTIGTIADLAGTPVYVAAEQGFFRKNGLDVTIKDYDMGLAAAAALLKGEVDIALMTEFVIVGKALQKQAISIIASHDKAQSVYLVTRKGRGRENIADLKGKRIGLARRGIAEFYLGRLLERQGRAAGEITLVDLRPAKAVAAFLAGQVDAVLVRQSFVEQIRQQLGDGIVVQPAQSDQPVYSVMAGRNDWLARHPQRGRNFLQALVQAEEYLLHHPAAAKAIIQKRLKFDDAFLAGAWPHHQFLLTLDYSLIAAMNDEARWMIRNTLTAEKTVPNFREYIHLDGLKAVKPQAVGILEAR